MTLAAQSFAAVSDLIEQARQIERDLGATQAGVDRLAELLKGLAAQHALFPREQFPVGPDGGTVSYRLAEDADGRFALYAITVVPGHSPAPHDHGTWAVVAGLYGREHNALFRRVGTDAAGEAVLEPAGEHVVEPGGHIALVPGVIHTIRELGDEPGLHLHFYGMALDRQDRTISGRPAPGGATRPQPRAALIAAPDLKALIRGGEELAILDVREEGAYAAGHLLFAASAPLSRLELLIERLVPRRTTRIVLTDASEEFAHRAAARLVRFGYRDIAVLRGGVAAWADAGYEIFSGVHVPSKAFGELVEVRLGTPHLTAAEVARRQAAGDDMVILDSRPLDEFRRMSIPGGVDAPGAELVHRAREAAPRPETLVVVNCAGRTRSIIGAQSLIDAGLPNRVVALENGTMGWEFAGLELAHGRTESVPPPGPAALAWAQAAAADVAARAGVRRISRAELAAYRADPSRSLFVFDVRGPEEFAAGHLPGARHAAGGQLVQETDRYVGTLRSRIVLVDNEAVRAPMTAAWLVQLGWPEVFLLTDGGGGALETGPEPRVVPGLGDARAPSIDPATLAARLASGEAAVFDIGGSFAFRRGHVPGAWSTTRARLVEAVVHTEAALLVVTAADDALARLGAADLAAATGRDACWLLGGTSAWTAAGHALETGAAERVLVPDDVHGGPYSPYAADPAAEKRAYLDWELALVAQIERDGDARFRPLGPAART